MAGVSLVCVPLVGKSVEQMLSEMATATAGGADVAEIRLDHLASFEPRRDLDLLLRNRPLPVLVTYRPNWEGGEYEGDDGWRFEALLLAMELGAEYVDIELKVAQEFVDFLSGKRPDGTKLIVSSHNYQSTPSIEDLSILVARIQAVGADIVKIATTAVDITDVARMFKVMVHCQGQQVPMIGLVMGDRGLMSRILCPKFGGYLTFAALSTGKESAPGQPSLSDLLDIYNIKQIKADTKVYGVVGKPVAHSKGPIIHGTAFRSVGYNAVYLPLLVDDFESFLSTYSSPDFAGFSVTMPHKEAALACSDEVDPIVKYIGAVNTLIKRPSDGKLIGYNTDYTGSISAIETTLQGKVPGASLADRIFVVIGAGGAGKALAYGAREKGARVVIANRTYERARELANFVGGQAISLADLENFHPEEGMILANTTSVGMYPNIHDTPLSKPFRQRMGSKAQQSHSPKVELNSVFSLKRKQALKSYALVFDAIYNPTLTRLLREAEELGVTIVTGVEMFVRQAMGQFEIFTGLPAPEKLMRETLLNFH
ncbi:bifunctional 3-dehydroquinate dehydratase/shikimate dehydrogenase, chloroplastic isoform X2 [Phalaenopsis equestris]|uniref:bifunctional 3-dehydroquinate dehydratase/shikimate dehydrogenase, chloroplastic isoform X2 n=1 Tax=Phalaenopsis equestris TaxID=78828 RepID=UPI0009E288CA|nr:bifunctional 3-dehydroquinate dehydratase/shikimate dehydrogenase, chloroplastic isoform X2 [Phalaenopsis equestris]